MLPSYVSSFLSAYTESGRMPAWRLADLILRSNRLPSDDAAQRQLLVAMRTEGYVSSDLTTAFVALKPTPATGVHSVTGQPLIPIAE